MEFRDQLRASQHLFRANVIHGVLTNGFSWKYLVLLLDGDRNGGEYSVSDDIAIKFDDSKPPRVLGNGPDVATNILAH